MTSHVITCHHILDMIPEIRGLAHRCLHHTLQCVLLRCLWLQVLDGVIRLTHQLIPEVVDHEVETGFGDGVDERRQDMWWGRDGGWWMVRDGERMVVADGV